MFTKKVPKSQSASKLLKILTKRSSLKKIQGKKGIYDEWPTQEKPSLFNYPHKYLKYVNNQEKQQGSLQKEEKNLKKQKGLKKVPATFSTCTTMQFYAPNQQKIRILSKFTSTPVSRDSDHEDFLVKHNNFTQYIASRQEQSQIIEQSDCKIGQFHELSFQKMNSKYISVKRPLQRKSSTLQKRQVKTAKINRQRIQAQVEQQTKPFNQSRKLSLISSTKSFSRPKTAKTVVKSEIEKPQKNKSLFLTCSKFNQNYCSQNQQTLPKYPLRLKDYENNFQAYKVISDLIDQQMKWQPKRIRPKSSAAFKKMNHSLKY